MQQEFNIENFRFVKDNQILVYIERDKIAIPITIPREQFELFLTTNNKLVLPLIYSDDTTRQNSSCKLELSEYYELSDDIIHLDLYEYIVSHSIIFRGQVYKKSLVSINWAFARHKEERKQLSR